MLRMGRNPNEEKSQTQANDSSRSYSPYQSGETQKTTEPAASTKALTESETTAREIKDGTLSGFVGSGTSITGEATFKAMLRIDGHYSGRITSSSGSLLVGAGGQVDANVEVAVATIHGVVNGDIIAGQRIELGRAGKLNGNIQTPSLVIEQGGVFEGSCKMIQQKAATENPAKVERKESVLDATSLQPVRVDTATKADSSIKKPEISSVATAS
ncbi:MAG TPA: polymer-forming cytoskeletal protein [Pyrinomonadaceae bacterium]|nr:polymer-forming cytoskeletal protein [Pyrinomonadaceae bacterium]